MAGKAKPLTVIRMISFDGPDGEYKPMDECTEEELQLFRDKVGEKLSRVAESIINQRIANGLPIDIF